MTDHHREKYKFSFDVEKSLRYHHRMAARYKRMDRILIFSMLVFGSASFVDLVPRIADLPLDLFGGLTALIAAFVYAYKPAHQTNHHRAMHERFSNLAIEVRTSDPSKEKLGEWTATRLRIEQNEDPDVFWAVAAASYNEVCRAWRCDKNLVRITRWQKLTMYLLRHSEGKFRLEPNPAPHNPVAA